MYSGLEYPGIDSPTSPERPSLSPTDSVLLRNMQRGTTDTWVGRAHRGASRPVRRDAGSWCQAAFAVAVDVGALARHPDTTTTGVSAAMER